MPPTVEFLFDYASPYSFLANESLATRLPGIAIDYRPVYLRGMESFKTGMPYSAAKLAWLVRDLQRCADEQGTAFRVPPVFPINGLYALRGALAARRAGHERFLAYHRAMFRAVWQDARDVSSHAAVATLARELAMPELADALDEPAIKDALRANTDAAIRRGVFGVPSFFVSTHPDELFWGADRLHQVARAAR